MTKKKIAAKAPKETPKAEQQLDTLIGRVYLIKKTGYEILDGADALPSIKTIQEGTKDTPGGDMPYTFYENGRPVYVAIDNGNISPLAFPTPGEAKEKTATGEEKTAPGERKMGLSSTRLYSLAVTLAQTIEKIIELETTPKPSLIDQAKKIMTPTIAIVACVFVIFLILISMQ